MMKRFPSLEALDKLNYVLLVWGFPLMTLGILTGSMWAGIHWGNYWSWEPRQISSGIAWLFYGVILHGRITAGLREEGRASHDGGIRGGHRLLFVGRFDFSQPAWRPVRIASAQRNYHRWHESSERADRSERKRRLRDCLRP